MTHPHNPQPLQAGHAHIVPAWRRLVGTLWRIALRLVLAVSAVVLVLGALLFAAVLAVGLVLWALLRGRRPAPGVFSASYQRARRGRGPAMGEVVDVEVREVRDVSQATDGQQPRA